MKIPDAKTRSGQGKEEARNIAGLAIRHGEEQKGGYSESTQRKKENPLCYIDGHLSSQECGVGTKSTTKSTETESPR